MRVIIPLIRASEHLNRGCTLTFRRDGRKAQVFGMGHRRIPGFSITICTTSQPLLRAYQAYPKSESAPNYMFELQNIPWAQCEKLAGIWSPFTAPKYERTSEVYEGFPQWVFHARL